MEAEYGAALGESLEVAAYPGLFSVRALAKNPPNAFYLLTTDYWASIY